MRRPSVYFNIHCVSDEHQNRKQMYADTSQDDHFIPLNEFANVYVSETKQFDVYVCMLNLNSESCIRISTFEI